MSTQASFHLPSASMEDAPSILQSGPSNDAESASSAVVIGAAVFSSLFLYSLLQLFRHRAWFYSTISLAVGLESAGFIALGYLSSHVTDHTAYLISFSMLTFAPSLLVFAMLSAFGQLLNNSEPLVQDTDSRRQRMARSWMVPAFVMVEGLAVMCFVYAMLDLSALHSPKPIMGMEEAVQRIASEANAIEMLRAGYIVQFTGLSLFALVSYVPLTPRQSSNDSRLEYLRWAIQAITAFCLVRSAVKVTSFASLSPQALDVLEGGVTAWLVDIVPLICGFAILMKYNPAIRDSATRRESISEKSSRLEYDNGMMSC